ncbi:MAG TPA: hypothetical protein DCZ48_03525, partial [Methylococcaceae bacterium]|nr:hypothetical protein [Methylococcaceae bacterium]
VPLERYSGVPTQSVGTIISGGLNSYTRSVFDFQTHYKNMKKPKSIQLKIIEKPEDLIHKAKQAAENYGLQFLGDIEQGIIKGFGIEADYMLQEDILTITVFRKPILISWATVEQKVRTLVQHA